MARLETNKAPRKIIVDGDGPHDSILISAQTITGIHLAGLTVVDGNTLPENRINVITVVDDVRFEIRADNQLYLKAGVPLEPGKYSIKLSATDAGDPLLTRTQTLKFKVDQPNDLHFTGAIDASGTRDDGTMLWGAGNPSTDYTIAINDRAGVEFGFNVHYRTGEQIAGHLGTDGFFHFSAPSGHQVAGVGSVSEEILNRSATSVDYALITALNGTLGEVADYVVKLFVDLDSTKAVNYKTFTMVNAGEGINYFKADQGLGGFGEATTLTVAEDSINFGYKFLADPLNTNAGDLAPGTYDMVAQVWDASGTVQLVGNHIVLDVV